MAHVPVPGLPCLPQPASAPPHTPDPDLPPSPASTPKPFSHPLPQLLPQTPPSPPPTVKGENYGEAARLKAALAALDATDPVAQAKAALEAAIREERYQVGGVEKAGWRRGAVDTSPN